MEMCFLNGNLVFHNDKTTKDCVCMRTEVSSDFRNLICFILTAWLGSEFSVATVKTLIKMLFICPMCFMTARSFPCECKNHRFLQHFLLGSAGSQFCCSPLLQKQVLPIYRMIAFSRFCFLVKQVNTHCIILSGFFFYQSKDLSSWQSLCLYCLRITQKLFFCQQSFNPNIFI